MAFDKRNTSVPKVGLSFSKDAFLQNDVKLQTTTTINCILGLFVIQHIQP